jgi:pyridoxal phosphate enzyme (YggS family)
MDIHLQHYLSNKKVTLVAVSKTHPDKAIIQLYNENQRVFGENKVQELVGKFERLPKDIAWHFIGHLQSNKVKYIAPFIDTIHSIDSLKILKEINKQAIKNNRIIKCLIQVKIAKEKEKFGIEIADLPDFLEEIRQESKEGIAIIGLMGMATYTSDENQIKEEFQLLQHTFKQIKKSYFPNDENFKELSMGMSLDYKIAIECGSTMIRIGSLLFGDRNHQ